MRYTYSGCHNFSRFFPTTHVRLRSESSSSAFPYAHLNAQQEDRMARKTKEKGLKNGKQFLASVRIRLPTLLYVVRMYGPSPRRKQIMTTTTEPKKCECMTLCVTHIPGRREGPRKKERTKTGCGRTITTYHSTLSFGGVGEHVERAEQPASRRESKSILRSAFAPAETSSYTIKSKDELAARYFGADNMYFTLFDNFGFRSHAASRLLEI